MIRALMLPFRSSFAAYEDEKLIGLCDIDIENGVIRDLDIKDPEPEFVYEFLIRSSLGYLNNKKIKNVVCKDTRYPEILKKIGFDLQNNEYIIDTFEFIRCKCCGNK